MAKPVVLRAGTNVPGIIFGLGPALVTQAHRSLRTSLAKGAAIVCTVTAIRVSGLYNRSAHLVGSLSKRKISPYFALALKSARRPIQSTGTALPRAGCDHVLAPVWQWTASKSGGAT